MGGVANQGIGAENPTPPPNDPYPNFWQGLSTMAMFMMVGQYKSQKNSLGGSRL